MTSGASIKYYNTTLIETWSFYNDRKPLLGHLKEALQAHGFVLKPRSFDEVYQKLVETGKDKYIIKLILFMMNFLEQYKTSVSMRMAFQFSARGPITCAIYSSSTSRRKSTTITRMP